MRIAEIAFVGVLATAVADLWQRALVAGVGLPATDWSKIGRWVAWLPRGVLVHRSITATPRVRGEAAIGWVFHYVVGLVYAALFWVVLRHPATPSSNFIAALVFASVTLAAPWFVLQPALGLGMLARRAPNPTGVRFTTITTHLAFGLGLTLGVDIWRLLVRA